jgi:hypothetical protein
MSEVDLPIFTRLAAAELVEGLVEMESTLGVCLGADRASQLDPMDGGSLGWNKGSRKEKRALGPMCSELWMAVMTSVAWPKGRIRQLSLKIHPLGDVIPPSLRRVACSSGS